MTIEIFKMEKNETIIVTEYRMKQQQVNIKRKFG